MIGRTLIGERMFRLSAEECHAMFTITPFRRAACALPIAALGAVLSATAQAAPPNFDDFVNAYIYGYGPTAFAATEAVTTAVPNATTTPGASPRNQFSYSTALDTPSETTVIRPSANLLYANAFLDLRRQPMVLQVPDMTGRYYLVPMLDAYTNDFVSIGTRTTGSAAGAYAIVGPGWHGTLPSTLSGVIHAPTKDHAGGPGRLRLEREAAEIRARSHAQPEFHRPPDQHLARIFPIAVLRLRRQRGKARSATARRICRRRQPAKSDQPRQRIHHRGDPGRGGQNDRLGQTRRVGQQ
jgi:hypothetical protein